MDWIYNKHYITVDAVSRITDGWSDAFRPATDDAICINNQGGYQFRLFPGGAEAENPSLTDPDTGVHLYVWDDGAVRAATAEEMEAERLEIEANTPPPGPTAIEQLQEKNRLLRAQNQAVADRQEFLEDCIAEMAGRVYAV